MSEYEQEIPKGRFTTTLNGFRFTITNSKVGFHVKAVHTTKDIVFNSKTSNPLGFDSFAKAKEFYEGFNYTDYEFKNKAGFDIDVDLSPEPIQMYCTMAGKGFCRHEFDKGKCNYPDNCKNHTTKKPK